MNPEFRNEVARNKRAEVKGQISLGENDGNIDLAVQYVELWTEQVLAWKDKAAMRGFPVSLVETFHSIQMRGEVALQAGLRGDYRKLKEYLLWISGNKRGIRDEQDFAQRLYTFAHSLPDFGDATRLPFPSWMVINQEISMLQ